MKKNIKRLTARQQFKIGNDVYNVDTGGYGRVTGFVRSKPYMVKISNYLSTIKIYSASKWKKSQWRTVVWNPNAKEYKIVTAGNQVDVGDLVWKNSDGNCYSQLQKMTANGVPLPQVAQVDSTVTVYKRQFVAFIKHLVRWVKLRITGAS